MTDTEIKNVRFCIDLLGLKISEVKKSIKKPLRRSQQSELKRTIYNVPKFPDEKSNLEFLVYAGKVIEAKLFRDMPKGEISLVEYELMLNHNAFKTMVGNEETCKLKRDNIIITLGRVQKPILHQIHVIVNFETEKK